MNATLEFNLKQLSLEAFLVNYTKEAEESIKKKTSYFKYLNNLASLEVDRRTNKLIQSRLHSAKFPVVKTLDTFDFSQIKTVDKKAIYQLTEGHFISSSKNIIFFGPCGTGKTHLAIALGRELCLKKYKIYFSNVCNFIGLLQEANHNMNLSKFFKRILRNDLIILDELGYIPFEQGATNLLFQFFAEAYERNSILITTNLAFSQWDQIFKDKQVTVAAVDRLIHHSFVLEFNETSYRLKSSMKEKARAKK